jgi:hypothetical protein
LCLCIQQRQRPGCWSPRLLPPSTSPAYPIPAHRKRTGRLLSSSSQYHYIQFICAIQCHAFEGRYDCNESNALFYKYLNKAKYTHIPIQYCLILIIFYFIVSVVAVVAVRVKTFILQGFSGI